MRLRKFKLASQRSQKLRLRENVELLFARLPTDYEP